MSFIAHNTEDDLFATIDAGYAVGVDGSSMSANALPVLPISRAKWAEYIAISDAKKRADANLGNLIIPAASNGGGPTHASGTIDLNAQTIDLALT